MYINTLGASEVSAVDVRFRPNLAPRRDRLAVPLLTLLLSTVAVQPSASASAPRAAPVAYTRVPATNDARAGPADFQYSLGTPLRKVFVSIAQRGGFQVVFDRQIARTLTARHMALELWSIEPLEALYVVADVWGLAVERLDDMGARPKYRICQARKGERAPGH